MKSIVKIITASVFAVAALEISSCSEEKDEKSPWEYFSVSSSIYTSEDGSKKLEFTGMPFSGTAYFFNNSTDSEALAYTKDNSGLTIGSTAAQSPVDLSDGSGANSFVWNNDTYYKITTNKQSPLFGRAYIFDTFDSEDGKYRMIFKTGNTVTVYNEENPDGLDVTYSISNGKLTVNDVKADTTSIYYFYLKEGETLEYYRNIKYFSEYYGKTAE